MIISGGFAHLRRTASGAERLIWSLWCLYVWLLVCWCVNSNTKFRNFHLISKIPKREHVSAHSEQLWFSGPDPSPSPHPQKNSSDPKNSKTRTYFRLFWVNLIFGIPPPSILCDHFTRFYYFTPSPTAHIGLLRCLLNVYLNSFKIFHWKTCIPSTIVTLLLQHN